MTDEPVPIDELIAGFRQMVERVDERPGRWPQCEPIMRAVLATLEAQPALLAVVTAARNLLQHVRLQAHKSGSRLIVQSMRANALQQAIDALPPAPPVSPWRPIETAPKDGTDILACFGANCLVVGWDDDPEHPGFSWITADGPRYPDQRFTHWMPLPPAPDKE
jgi:hypothetical protein